MNCPGEGGQEGHKPPSSFPDFPEQKQFVAKEEQSQGRAEMAKDAGEMIAGRFENERPVIEQISQPLDRPVEIRCSRIDKKKMLKCLRSELPASNERIAQDQSGIVPDKFVPQRRRIDPQRYEDQQKKRQDFFQQRNWVGQKQ